MAIGMTTEMRLLRPMPFGRVDGRHVRDPIIEPLWVGRRALGHIHAGDVSLTDETGEAIGGFESLRAALAAACQAESIVVDGYLTNALPETTGISGSITGDGYQSLGQLGRQMLVGGGGSGREARRDDIDAAAARRAATLVDEDSAFVAVDLLTLDGEDLLDVPLLERKRLLESAIGESERVRRTAIVRAPAGVWYAQWRAMGFLEMAFKAANGRYTPGVPSRDWAIVRIPRR